MSGAHTTGRHGTAPPPARGWALAGLAVAMLLSSLGTSVANVALPTLGTAFGASFAQVQWVVLSYLLAVTSLVAGAGRLGDLVGRRRLLVAGLAVFTGASVGCAVAPTLLLLVAARAVQGVGAAVMMALALALVADIAPAGRTGAAMGLLGTTSAIGTALGPSLGGSLIAVAGWRAIFLVNVPLGLVALVLARRHLPARGEPAPATRHTGVDLPGTALLALALGAYALAMTTGHGAGVVRVALVGAAVAAALAFVVVETRARSPLIRPALLRDPVLRGGLSTSALVSTVMMATLVVGPFHLDRALGLGPAVVGLVMSAGPAAVVVAGVPAGRLADRFGAGRVTVAGLGVMVPGAVALAMVPVRCGVVGYLVPVVVVTVGYALFQTANNTGVMEGAPPDGRGVVSGMLSLSRNLGLVTGASAMGAVFALGAGSAHLDDAPAHAVAAGTHLTFAVASLLLGVALAIAAHGRRRAPLAGGPVPVGETRSVRAG